MELIFFATLALIATALGLFLRTEAGKFNKRGIDHIVEDYLTKNLGITQKSLTKVDEKLRQATFEKLEGLHKTKKC